MPKMIDLTGRKFGKLTVIEMAEPHRSKNGQRKIAWKCECDCGCVVDVLASCLSSGNSTSCGCSRVEDLTGKRFGRLFVQGYVGNLRDNEWECRCDCGNNVVINGRILKSGDKKSCGCGMKINLAGQKFGMLTAIEPVREKGLFMWRCKCDCGKETFARASELTKNIKTSCGCKNDLNLIGKKFGRLFVIKDLGMIEDNTKYKYHKFECICDCGNVCQVIGSSLISGNTKSCGCLNDEVRRVSNRKHGRSYDRLYGIYANILQRCYNPNNGGYSYYGKRGITMCEEWKNDYLAFEKWAYSNGYDSSLPKTECTIDRIDVNGNYCPENCRWVNMKFQGNNRRNNKYIEFNGEVHTVSEWSDIVGISCDTLYSRLSIHKWPVEKALTMPLIHEGYNRKEANAIG